MSLATRQCGCLESSRSLGRISRAPIGTIEGVFEQRHGQECVRRAIGSLGIYPTQSRPQSFSRASRECVPRAVKGRAGRFGRMSVVLETRGPHENAWDTHRWTSPKDARLNENPKFPKRNSIQDAQATHPRSRPRVARIAADPPPSVSCFLAFGKRYIGMISGQTRRRFKAPCLAPRRFGGEASPSP